jgi:hypothetical protein
VKIANDERLSILKEYARKHFNLTKNVRILVLLISENETIEYRKLAAKEIETNQALKEYIRKHSPDTSHHETAEILPTEACLVDLKKPARYLHIKLLEQLASNSRTKILHLEKFEYVVLIREELLEPFGKRKLSQCEGCCANFAELALSWLLAHEIMHVIEEETGIQIYGSQEKDDIHQFQVLNSLPQEYWKKGVKNGIVRFSL